MNGTRADTSCLESYTKGTIMGYSCLLGEAGVYNMPISRVCI